MSVVLIFIGIVRLRPCWGNGIVPRLLYRAPQTWPPATTSVAVCGHRAQDVMNRRFIQLQIPAGNAFCYGFSSKSPPDSWIVVFIAVLGHEGRGHADRVYGLGNRFDGCLRYFGRQELTNEAQNLVLTTLEVLLAVLNLAVILKAERTAEAGEVQDVAV